MTATISLDELLAESELLNRVDRKYLISAADLPAIITRLETDARVLTIEGLSWFSYQSLYFDTPDLDCYTAAGRGRRRQEFRFPRPRAGGASRPPHRVLRPGRSA